MALRAEKEAFSIIPKENNGGQPVRRTAGCCARAGVKMEAAGGYSNFIEVPDLMTGMIYPSITKSYGKIFRPKPALLFSNPMPVFRRGPP